MPSYGNVLAAGVCGIWRQRVGDCFYGCDFPAPFKSAQVALAPAFSSGKVRAAVEIVWSAAPGVISVQLQTADTDIDAAYVQEGAAISIVNTANVTRQSSRMWWRSSQGF